jgi:hypothetical protein
MAIDARHRDKNGEIGRKHGKTLIHIFRRHYGTTFAKGCGCREKLGNLLEGLDELPSATSSATMKGENSNGFAKGSANVEPAAASAPFAR